MAIATHNKHAKIEAMEMVFSIWSDPRLYIARRSLESVGGCHAVPGGYIYGDLAHQVGEVLNLRQ
jgi:hypothetical protein